MNKKFIVLILCAVAQMQGMEFDISSVQQVQVQMQKEQSNRQKLQGKQNETEQLLEQSSSSYKQAPNNVGKVRETANAYIFQLNTMSRQNLELASINIRLQALEKIIVLLKQIENLQRQLSEQKNISQQLEKINTQYANELQSTKKRLQDLAKSSTENKTQLQEQVKLLQTNYDKLQSVAASERQQAQVHEAMLVEAEKEFKQELASERNKAQAQENKIRQDLNEALKLLPKTSAKDGQQIEKLRIGIQLLENRLDSQRARADKLWVELQATRQKPTGNPITRFFNWARGKKQQAAN